MQKGHPHNPKRNKHLDGVFFNPKQNVVSLKRRTITFELNRRAFTVLYRRSVLVVLMLVCAGIIGAGYVRQTLAETNLYPHTCLGGWNNSARAEGAPDLDGSDWSAYNDSNSASISNALSEIYCGQFTGDAPPNTVPTKTTLKFSWAVRKTPPPVVITSDSFASSTREILNASATTTALIVMEPTSTPPSTTIPAEPTPAPDVQPQDVPQNAIPMQPDPPSQPGATPPQSDTQPQSFIDALAHLFAESIAPRAYAQVNEGTLTADQSSTMLDSTSAPASTSSVASSAAETSTSSKVVMPATADIVEISYTLDGTTWHSLGSLSRLYLQNASLAISLNGIHNWDDLAHLQISVRSLSGMNSDNTLYLDGMTLTADYAQAPDQALLQQDLPDTPLAITYVANATDQFTLRAIAGNDGTPGLEFSAPGGGNLIVFRGIRKEIFFTAGLGNQPSQFPLYTFPPDTYTALDTKNPEACTTSIDACQTAPGYVSESIFTISVASSTSVQ